MKRNLFAYIIALLFCGKGTDAQTIQRTVQPTAGGTLTAGNNQLSFTIGETVIPTLAAGSNTITQGFQQPGEQLQTGTLSGTNFCAGSTVSIPYSAIDIGGGNSFTAQLSDASGSFANPIIIGSTSGNASGSIIATIPPNTTTGSAYRIRIISSFPALSATDNNGSTAGLLVALSPNLWIGGNGNWSNAANWCANTVPVSNASILINDGHPKLDVDFTAAGTLTLAGTASLTILPQQTLDIPTGGSINFGDRPVTFRSDSSGYASLGQVRGAIAGISNITIERYIPNNNFRSWRLLSIPTKSTQTIKAAWQEGNSPMGNNVPNFGTIITGPGGGNGLDGHSAGASMLRWNGTGWTGITSTSAPISNYNAYFLFVRGERTKGITGLATDASATTLRTHGSIYHGDSTINVGANAFAIIPNLYPSAIDFTGLARSGGVANTFYIWDSKKLSGNSLGVYQTFSATNGFNCLIDGGSYTPGVTNTTIESGQAFFVQSTTAGSITFRESAKINNTSGNQGFRPFNPAANPAKVHTSLYEGGNMIDANVVVFDKAYSNNISLEDAPKYANPGANFSIEKNSQLLAIEGTSPLTGNDSIQFYMWNLKKQQYELRVQLQNIPDASGELTAVLQDRFLKTSIPLLPGGTTNVSFAITDDTASANARRFLILFKKSTIATPASAGYGYTISPNPVQNGIVNILFGSNCVGNFDVRIFSGNGQAIGSKTMYVQGNSKHSISLPKVLAQGMYTVEITGPGQIKTSKKIMVQ